MSPLIRNLLLALVLAVIVWLGYTLFVRPSDEMVTALDTPILNDATQDSNNFLIRLQQLEHIDLKGEVLRDARFRSLANFKQDVLAEPVGRKDPFLPINETE